MDSRFSRNHFYIDPTLQEKISKAKILFLGVGLASTLAEVMVRTGFSHFYLYDGDRIELSNLNRQNFTNDCLGEFKALRVRNRLLSINPTISCEAIADRVESIESIADLINSVDIIVNTIDCGPLYFEIIEKCRAKNKLVICPFNPGFGGLFVCFTHDSHSSFDFFETATPCDDSEVARCLLNKPGVTIASQAGKCREDFFCALSEMGYFPQLGIGAFLTGGIVTTALVEFLKTGKIVKAPDFFYLPAHYKEIGDYAEKRR